MNPILKSVHLRRTTSKSNVNCSVFGCNSINKKNPELSFHRFPPPGQKVPYIDSFGIKTVTDRRKLWELKLKMGKPVTPSMHVCSRHFTNDDYITPNEECYAKRFLKKTAVPSQNLPQRKAYYDNKPPTCKERVERLKNRRKLNEEKSQLVFHSPVDDNLKNFEDHFGEDDAAEVLLSLQQTDCETTSNDNYESYAVAAPSKTFISCSTQTNESYIFNKLECTKEIGVQVNTSWFSLVDFIVSDKALNILSGISTFNILYFLVNLFSTFKKDIRPHRLPVKDRILLVFLKIKLDLTYSALGVLFGGLSVTSVKRIFVETVHVLADIMKIFIFLPSKDSILKNMPKCFQKYQQVRIILDCTEISVQTPKKLCCRIKMYSHYKKRHTLKFMTGVTPSGFICYTSPCYGGRASDKSIFEQSKLIQQLEPYLDQIMVDKGFLIDQICEDYGINIVRPPFLRKKKQFNRSEALQNRRIASARVHIERVNARIKIFKIFKNTFPQHLITAVNDIFTIVCAIVNLSKPIMREDLFLKE